MATEWLQLPSFNHNVQDWLLHVQGYLANTSANDQQKFNTVVCALPTEVATLVQSTITSPPDSNKFADLKSALLDVYRRPDHHHLQELQTITLGDMRPSILWQQMQLINIRCNTSLPTAVLRSMFLQKLPWEAAKECIGQRPRSRRGFVSTETLEKIEESRAARLAGNQDQHRALSRRTRTVLGRDKERYVRSLAEDVEDHLNVNDLRLIYRVLKKLRSNLHLGRVLFEQQMGASCRTWMGSAELLKAGGEAMIRGLHAVLTAVWQSGTIPPDWKRGLVVPIWKGKGDRQDCNNYRCITLLSVPGKVFALLLLTRIRSHLLKHQRPQQSGFTPGKSTTDRILALRVLVERRREFRQGMLAAYVDLKKAFDSVHRESLWDLLRLRRISARTIGLITGLYSGTESAVKCGADLSKILRILSASFPVHFFSSKT
ncbi:Transposon TX1 uncharacterized protein [Chionoecetes opilio]|uniref:Transposon TX1 uncharacterized protein n=1 Tax=Chionoecetes opilio TaxID=41210 RepID=A0A8J4Y8G3_CHIOP|nr:Transposon TX1 uncharacterized protein [Chionoecetes opilio]